MKEKEAAPIAAKLPGAGDASSPAADVIAKNTTKRTTTNDSPNPDKYWADGRFLHLDLAHDMMERSHACRIRGAEAAWDAAERRFRMGPGEWDRAASRLCPVATHAQRREACYDVDLWCQTVEEPDTRYIGVKNGILDLKTLNLLTPDPSYHVTNVIPVAWSPATAAEPNLFDEAVAAWAAGYDEAGHPVSKEEASATTMNIIEVIGICCYTGHEIQKMPILIGPGGDGKSTFLNFLQHFLGEENYAGMDIARIGQRFQSNVLVGRLANVADDISNEMIDGSRLSVLKKVITGDLVSGEVKGGENFTFRPYATIVAAANEMPRLGDASMGMLDRLWPIRFTAHFERGSATDDQRMEDKLNADEVKERALFMGVMALKRMLKRKSPTPTAFAREQVREIWTTNDSVAWYLEEVEPNLAGQVVADAYNAYADWAVEAGAKPVGQKVFTRRTNAALHLTTIKAYGGREFRVTDATPAPNQPPVRQQPGRRAIAEVDDQQFMDAAVSAVCVKHKIADPVSVFRYGCPVAINALGCAAKSWDEYEKMWCGPASTTTWRPPDNEHRGFWRIDRQ